MKQLVVIAGLGLIGGSMAKAFKKHTDCLVYGWNRTRSVAERALADGAIDGIADNEVLARCDLLIPVLYPRATITFLERVIPTMKPGAAIVDLVGVKEAVEKAVTPLAAAHGVRYTGGHPMAGLARAGYERSFAELFDGASMILVPTETTGEGDLDRFSALFRQVGFGTIRICDAKTHDRMIAHTSQLAHVVSNCYVKSPVSANYEGFAGGSYRDMTRVAPLNEKVWTELFAMNRAALVEEIDLLTARRNEVRQAIMDGDEPTLEWLLREGREARERIELLHPNEPKFE